jgi:GH43 family beta-xylosidase
MRNTIAALAVALVLATFLNPLLASDTLLKTEDIRVRDPFIYADTTTKTYYLYAQSENRAGSGYKGVEVYTSKDLTNWLPPKPVLSLPDDTDTIMVWAPEVHEYKGAFYLFVTLTSCNTLPEKKPVETDRWPPMHIRGTHIFRADQPTGPFERLKPTSHTPEDWMALDGTLFVENDIPYMVFCHEWVQTIDGTMDVVQLADDLSDTADQPQLLFKASDAPGARTDPKAGKVTDGCFLYRSPKSGKLFMIWSTFIPGSDYCVLLTESQSGNIKGPWINQKPIYKKNGGHGMIFKSFDGHLMLALHQPNARGKERLHLFHVVDNGQTLEVSEP